MKNNNTFTVSEISNKIEDAITNSFNKPIKVQGEISNLKLFNGNVYMTIKDAFSSIKVVIWAYNKKKNTPQLEDGLQVIITGSIKIYTKTSTYQINAFDVTLFGIGNSRSKYNKLKKKFEKKGYFDNSNKKTLPSDIKNIGIVTSTDGAALKDVLFVLDKNGYTGNVFIKGCNSQGVDCPKTVIKGIDFFSKFKNENNPIDVIIITRGGGSFEDLFGFSDELLIEKIYKCKICIISAVGHEIDNMLSDYVADIRAPTPSVAGEIITSHQRKIIDELNILDNFIKYKLYSKINDSIYKLKNKMSDINSFLKKPEELIKIKEKELNELELYFNNYIKNKYLYNESKIKQIKQLLQILDPQLILDKGYSLIMDNNRNIIKNIKDLKGKKEIIVLMKDGEYVINISKIKKKNR